MKSHNFFAELKRRNVIRMAGLYLVGAWLAVQVAGTILPMFGAPEWLPRIIVVLLAIGFVPAAIFSWVFEITPEGLRREEDVAPEQSITPQTGRRMDRMIMVVMALALGYFAFDKFVLSPRREVALVKATAQAKSELTPNDSTLSAPAKSIAVLPFENLSDNKENAYFADGVQDEILTDLAKVADLKVISRTSVMQYRGAAARNLRQIGDQLGVAHVLEGSVQRAANRIRVNAQLIDARNDAHLWAQTYDRDLADVFAIQSEIAKTIAEQLQAQLSPREKAALAEAPTTDVVANDLYVRARALDDMANDPEAKRYLLQGISLLEEAVRRDPKFLLAYCLMSETQLDLYWYGFDHTTERRELGRAALQKAEQIQPDAGEVHMGKGIYAYHGFRDYDTALAEYETARRLLPNSSRLYLQLGAVDRRQSRWDKSLRDFDRAVELDPRNFEVVEEAAFTYEGLSQYDKARKLLQQAIEISPKDHYARRSLADLSLYEKADLGDLRRQLDVFRQEGAESTSDTAEVFVYCALLERDRQAAEAALSYVPEEGLVNNTENFLIPRGWFVGLVAKTFGDNDRAQSAFTAARAIEAKITEEQPDYAPAWSMLGLLDAGLGRKADAIAEGRHACELLPLSKDSWEGPSYVVNLAIIYSWLGEKDLALDQLDISIRNPVGITYGNLKLEPFWDPLRGDPRFDRIVATVGAKANARQSPK